MAAQHQLVLRGTMRGHTDRITAIDTPIDNSDMIVSSSRDKSIIVWSLTKEDTAYGVPRLRLTGHSHFVQDVVLTSDNRFALSGSCDGELRLWDLLDGSTHTRFLGHTNEVLSVALSHNQRTIVLASGDKTIKLWDTLGRCRGTFQNEDAHTDSVSCVRFIPKFKQPTIISGSWDGTVKIWGTDNCMMKAGLRGFTGHVNTVAVTADGDLCAIGGEGGVIHLWGLPEEEFGWDQEEDDLYSLDAGSIIHALCFCPNRYWVCAATEESIQIWDLNSEGMIVNLRVNWEEEKDIYCTSLNWSADGSTLFSGYTDGIIKVWSVESSISSQSKFVKKNLETSQ